MELLTKEDFIRINQKTVKRHGGNFVPPFNLLKEDGLDYVVEAVYGKIFAKPMYPELYEKAGLYLFSVISNHIFQDGNKRTGLESALVFLKLNGYILKNDLEKIELKSKKPIPKKGKNSEEILYNFIIEIASSELSLEDCQKWLAGNIEKQK